MGIKRETIEKVTITCDYCRGGIKDEEETKIHIPIMTYSSDIDAYIYGRLRLYHSYATSDGVLCKSCQLKALRKYVKKLENELGKVEIEYREDL